MRAVETKSYRIAPHLVEHAYMRCTRDNIISTILEWIIYFVYLFQLHDATNSFLGGSARERWTNSGWLLGITATSTFVVSDCSDSATVVRMVIVTVECPDTIQPHLHSVMVH